jgi:two-component system, cell cycle response regulator DivK
MNNRPVPVVLVVEDYDDTRMMMRWILETLGYQVFSAVDGEDAVSVAKRIKPDLILMDIHLPLIDGYDAIIRIRKSTGLENVPVIAVTADYTEASKSRAHEAGCNAFVAKPIDFEKLEKLVKQLIGSNELKAVK